MLKKNINNQIWVIYDIISKINVKKSSIVYKKKLWLIS